MVPVETLLRPTVESAATTAAYESWCAAWDAETEHRFICGQCPLIGYPACEAGEALLIKRVVCTETLRRARLADEEAA